MIKKTLIAITVVVLLTVMSQAAVAFDGKIHWDYDLIPVIVYELKEVPQNVGTYDVMFEIPHYAIIEPQDGEIKLEQTEGLNFCGSITIQAAANFDAVLTCEVTPNANGVLLQPDGSKWTCSVTDGEIAANQDLEDQTIQVCVEDVDLMAGLEATTEYKVAEVDLFIAPQ
jgi:hypothetical protein